MSIDGIINILKPAGKTSFQVVSLIRRLSGERRVGHTGTLDPEATGVLVICLGQGTKVAKFLSKDTKVYKAEIELGITTDTYDASGKVIQRCNSLLVTLEQLTSVLESFHGEIEQVPPMYSALKHEGKRLYSLARAGIEVARKPRKVNIIRLDLLNWQSPYFTIEVECSSGTYIRSLAHDIGIMLSCGACLKKLVRLRCGFFSIEQSINFSTIEEAFKYGYWQRFIHPIDKTLMNWKAVIVNQETENKIKNGRSVELKASSATSYDLYTEKKCRAYSADGHLIALLHWQPKIQKWHPEKVFTNRS